MRRVLIFFIFLLNFTFSFGQLDNEFWFVVPKITKDHNPGDAKRSYFVFTNSNDTDAYVTIQMPKEPAWTDTTIRVLKRSSYRWQVNTRLSTLMNTYILTDPNPYGRANKNVKGVHIISRLDVLKPDSRIDITIYYEFGNVNNPDIFTLKGKNALGTEFYTSFQTDCYNVGLNWSEPAYSAFDIVFTEDNTFIDLEIPAGKKIVNGFNSSGVAYAPLTGTVLNIGPFNAGETFSCIPSKNTAPEKTGWYASDKYFGRAAADHLAGVHLKTRNGKKVAITLKDDSMKELWSGCYDLNGDQTVPVGVTGNDYIAMRGQLNTGYPDNGWYNRPPTAHQWYNPNPTGKDTVQDMERLYIMATDNNTRIQIDGTTVATLSAGQQYIYPIPSAKKYTYVKSLDSSIYVYQITGFGCEEGGAVLPTISTCTGSTSVGFARTVGGTGNGFFQNILVRTNAKSGFRINGKINSYLNASKFTDIASTGWSVARLGFTNNPPDSVGNYLFPAGVITNISNDIDVFHLGIINGGASSGTRYGYFSNYNAVKPTAYISESGTGDIRICYGQGVQIYAKGGVFYSWNPAVYLSDPLSDHPIATPPYTIDYVATVQGYCGVKDSTSINIAVSPPMKAVYSLDKTFGCAPLKVRFHDKSEGAKKIRYWYNYITDADPPDFTWNFGVNKTQNDSIFYHTYTNTVNPDTYKVAHTKAVVINAQGCSDTLKRNLITYPTVTTSITTPSATACDSFPVNFAQSSQNAHYYAWEFGDAGSSDSTAPSHVFRNYTSGDVTYTTRLIASSKYFCKDTAYKTFTIHPQLEANFTIDSSKGCADLPIHITNQATGTVTLYNWTFGEGPPDVTASKKNYDLTYHNDSNITLTRTVNLTVSNSGVACTRSFSRNIIVYPHVHSSFIASDSVDCNPLSTNFTAAANKVPVLWTWDFGDGASSALQNPSHLFENFTNFDDTFKTKLLVTSANGCKDSTSKNIVVHERIDAGFTINPAIGCGGFSSRIHNTSSGGIFQYDWDFGDHIHVIRAAAAQPDSFSQIFNNFTNFPIIDTVTLVVDNNNGCTAPFTAYLTVNPNVIASFTYDKVKGCTPFTTHFTNTSNKIRADQFTWTFGDGASSFEKDTVSHTYDNFTSSNRNLTALLTVRSSSTGCWDTATVPVTVYKYIKADFKIDDASLCAYQSTSLKDTSRGGIAKRYWDFQGNGKLDSTRGTSFLYKYSNNTTDSVIKYLKLKVRNDKYCYDSIIRPVVVYPHIALNFTMPATACDSQTVSFTNTTNAVAIYHNWDFGDGTSSTDKSPTHTFFHLNSTITPYIVKLTEISKFQCDTSATKTISVDSYIDANFTINKSAICPGDSIQFTNTSPQGAVTNLWTIDGSSFTNNVKNIPFWRKIQNPDSTLRPITIRLYVSTQSNKCHDSLTRPANLYPKVLANFRTSDNKYFGCNPFNVKFKNLSNSNAKYFTWNFGDNSSSSATDTSHLFENTTAISIPFIVRLHATSVNNCTHDTSKVITVYPYIDADFKVKKANICSDSSVEITDNTPSGVTFRWWDFDNNKVFDDSSATKKPPFPHKYTNPDTSKLIINYLKMVVRNNYNCYDKDSTPITIYPTIISDFTYTPAAGCTPQPVSFTKSSRSLLSFNWNFGDGNTSNLPNPEHEYVNNVKRDTTYHATLKVVSQYLCESSKSHDITVYSYINADFKVPEANICSGTKTQIFDTSLFVGNITKREWNSTGLGVVDTLTEYPKIFLHAINTTSSVNVKPLYLTVYNKHNCPSTISREIRVYPKVTAKFTANPPVVCSPYPVSFINNTKNATDYNWSFGDLNTSSLENPVNYYINYTNSDAYYVVKLIAISQYLCSDSTVDTVYVNYKPKASFFVDKSVECPPFNVVLHNTSVTNLLTNSQYNWHFGDNSTDTVINNTNNFIHTFYNSSDSFRTYPVRLITFTNKGCSDTANLPIHIYPQVIANFDTITRGCNPLVVDTIHNTSSPTATYFYWDFGDTSFTNQKNPSHVFYNDGIANKIFPVMLRAYSTYGCSDSILYNLVVYPAPNANFRADKIFDYYPDATFNFYNKTNNGPWIYDWDFGDDIGLSNSSDSVTYTYQHWGNFKVILHVTGGQCSDTAMQDITLKAPVPIAKFDSSAAGCSPVTVFFNSDSTKWANTYHWQFDDGTTSDKKNPSHTFYNAKDYNVILTVIGDGGTSFDQKMVRVYSNPVAQFSIRPTQVMIPNATIRCFNSTPGDSNKYTWYFGDGGESSLSDPVYKYSQTGTYTIRLVVTSENNCLDSTTGSVSVGATGRIKFPNAFLPNMSGPSGGKYNITDVDVFYPNYDGVAEYRLEIYNRWGELIFVSDDVTTGWDGYYKGQLCPQGVYVYKAKGKFYDNQAFNVVGDVTLLLRKGIK